MQLKSKLIELCHDGKRKIERRQEEDQYETMNPPIPQTEQATCPTRAIED